MREAISIPEPNWRWAFVLFSLIGAFAVGVAVSEVATANHYHTAGSPCGVGNGLVHGSSTTDGSFHARVEDGCGSTQKFCRVGHYTYGALYETVSYVGTCNAWNGHGPVYPTYPESSGYAVVGYSGVFDNHLHTAH